MIDSLKQWETLHAQTGFEPVYPTESVVRWTHRQFPRGTSARLLDLGAGHGRHALFWARNGHEAYATDAAITAVEACRTKAEQAGLSVHCTQAGALELPFADGFFDGLLSFGVHYYLPWTDWQPAFDEIHRVLAPGGRALIVVRSTDDSRCTTGEQLSEHEWRVASPPDCPWAAEVGMPMTFVDEPELATLASRFRSMILDQARWSDRGGCYWNVDWLVQLRK